MSTIRIACRTLVRAPGFSLTVVAVLGLSIGALTTVFSVIDAVLLRPPGSVPDADRVAWLSSTSRLRAHPEGLSYREFAEVRDYTTAGLTEVAAYDAPQLSISSEHEPQRVRGHVVAGGYFRLLGVRTVEGRSFVPDELSPHAGVAVAILGFDLWRGRFGADTTVVGRSVLINGRSFQVVGIAPPGFRGPELGAEADVWLPLGAADAVLPAFARALDDPAARVLRVLVRAKPGVNWRALRGSLTALAIETAARVGISSGDRTYQVTPLNGGVPPDGRGEAFWSAGFFGAVAVVVVVIACLNVANLLLARVAHRRLELTIRDALGASQWQLARHILTESALLATAGGISGLLVSVLAVRVLQATWPVPALATLRIDPRSVVLVVSATGVTGLLFGVGPALRTSPGALHGLRAVGDRALGRLQRSLVVGQIGLSLVLLMAAGQFVLALRSASRIDLGFAPAGLSVFSVDLVTQNYSTEARRAFEIALEDQLRATAGIQGVALGDVAPISGVMIISPATVDGAEPGSEALRVGLAGVTPAYFETLGIRLVEGRGFDPRDAPGGAPVAIVNRTAARALLRGGPIIGREIRLEDEDMPVQVVGVVGDSKYDEPLERPTPFVYFARRQRTFLDRTTVFIRGAAGRPVGANVIRRIVGELDHALPVFDLATMNGMVRTRMERQATMARILVLFGLAGVTIAAVGLYGISNYTVSQRKREFGVRLALGAEPRGVVAMVIVRSLKISAIGITLGGLVSIPVVLVLSKAVFGVGSGSATLFVFSALLLGAVSALATLSPAIRAARTDPVTTLNVT